MCTKYQVDSGCAAALIAPRVGEIATGRLRSALAVGAMAGGAADAPAAAGARLGGCPSRTEFRLYRPLLIGYTPPSSLLQNS